MINVSHSLTFEPVTDFQENWHGHHDTRSHPNFTVPLLTITNNNKMAGEKPLPLYVW